MCNFPVNDVSGFKGPEAQEPHLRCRARESVTPIRPASEAQTGAGGNESVNNHFNRARPSSLDPIRGRVSIKQQRPHLLSHFASLRLWDDVHLGGGEYSAKAKAITPLPANSG
ncbi:hypothetical protein AAFF_G00280270 [Aldrovandia affinis]|uniref:Uncharacterized protein n=1 Tax=Aldrovandia affinis TaxID=143900 RepID=A0AAD7RAE0_9TELE|nr:hypothetical protein AAFF_G00280270 [Aldrovandia affinis]